MIIIRKNSEGKIEEPMRLVTHSIYGGGILYKAVECSDNVQMVLNNGRMKEVSPVDLTWGVVINNI